MSGERHALFTCRKSLPATIPASRGAPIGGEDCRKQDYAVLIVVGLPAKLEMPRGDNVTPRKQAPASVGLDLRTDCRRFGQSAPMALRWFGRYTGK
jgi:hypothetical protein